LVHDRGFEKPDSVTPVVSVIFIPFKLYMIGKTGLNFLAFLVDGVTHLWMVLSEIIFVPLPEMMVLVSLTPFTQLMEFHWPGVSIEKTPKSCSGFLGRRLKRN